MSQINIVYATAMQTAISLSAGVRGRPYYYVSYSYYVIYELSAKSRSRLTPV